MVSRADLENDLKQAIRSSDEVRKRTLRMVLSSLKLAEVEKRGALDDAAIAGIVRKEIKMRQEAIEEAQRAGRQDLIQASQAEVAVLEGYLPKAIDPAELDALVRQAIAEAGAVGPQDMGKVMKVLVPRVEGRADGKQLSSLVRDLLSRA
ncbi:MAG: GatB/YqeY domain-containing protein [Chloroflexi bacterium]|nr:GatB/YqeY domain-containing protein [Chloroflexota bacterium]